MKIVSNFQDVYDQCAMYGIDEDTVYRRFIKVHSVKMEGDYAVMSRHLATARLQARWFERQLPDLHLAPTGNTSIMFLVVGDHVIPHVGGLEKKHWSDATGAGEAFYTTMFSCCDLKEVTSAEELRSPMGRVFRSYAEMAHHMNLKIERQVFMQRRWHKEEANELVDFSGGLFSFGDDMSVDELMAPFRDERWALAIGSPLALVVPSVVERRPPMRKDRSAEKVEGAMIIHNPSIKYLGLTSLMDPYTMHQEISMAMNGFLSKQEDGCDSISDGDKAIAKGFDDTSFKTRKGTKKPRRKKSPDDA